MTQPTGTSAADTAAPQATSLYVYGVIPAADAGGWPGAAGVGGPSAQVSTIAAGELAALVSALPPDRTPGLREDLEAHRQVLSLATERGTVVPIRFGMVMDGEDGVRERLLARHGAELTELLRAVDGQVQMTVRGFYAEDALMRAVVEADPEIARRSAEIEGVPELESRAERIALGELVAAAVDTRRERDEQALLDRLRPFATDIRVDSPGSERVALNAHLLVPRDGRAALDEAVRELDTALQGYMALRYIGPLPPYSFSELSLEPEEVA
ncbi:MAG TPA: GvpL/GvpF family gas vesicle protein [Solirubrobacteraceae bacterium]|nr:GvpL/GvpF family gas vesicle protein [Solirubrobacteraceae bacterium]